MKIVLCCLLIFALTSAYAKSIGDAPAEQQKDVQTTDNQSNLSNPSTGNVSADQAEKDNQRKYLEAMFALHQAQIAQQMWNIFNSK